MPVTAVAILVGHNQRIFFKEEAKKYIFQLEKLHRNLFPIKCLMQIIKLLIKN